MRFWMSQKAQRKAERHEFLLALAPPRLNYSQGCMQWSFSSMLDRQMGHSLSLLGVSVSLVRGQFAWATH